MADLVAPLQLGNSFNRVFEGSAPTQCEAQVLLCVLGLPLGQHLSLQSLKGLIPLPSWALTRGALGGPSRSRSEWAELTSSI